MRSLGLILALAGYLVSPAFGRAQDVLIVADEFHAMQILAAHLEQDTKVRTRIVGQLEMPPSLASYRAVLVYLHGELQATAECEFIQYANDGGDLILLHHTISSRKRENKDWYNFLHIELPSKPFAEGGYAYFAPVTYQVVNLAAKNPITTKRVAFDQKVVFMDSPGKAESTLPATSFPDTEVYVNHVLTGQRILLLGMKYTDVKTSKIYMQDTAGWMMPASKGVVFYFMMGHRAEDFDNAAYRQILDNAVEYQK
jgi:hypothetical protein